MTTYEKIRQIRNNHFPPKLEFGCELVFKKDHRLNQYFMFEKGDIITFCYKDHKYESYFLSKSIRRLGIFMLDRKDFEVLKNLGKPIFDDILKIMKLKGREFYYANLERLAELLGSDLKAIKDQDEEALRQIYDLIK